MSTKTEEFLTLVMHYQQVPICDVQWYHEDKPNEECTNKAEYTVWAHENAEEPHRNSQLLMCKPCLELLDGTICPDHNQYTIGRVIPL